MPSTWADLLKSYGTMAGIWRMQETSGTAASNYSGAAPAGTYAGSTLTLNQTGGLFESGNKAVLMDRTGGDGTPRCEVAASTETDLTGNAWSIGLWVKYTGANVGDRRLISNRDGSGNGYELYLSDVGGGNYRAAVYAQGAEFPGLSNLPVTGSAAWTQLIVTYDDTNLKIYVNATENQTGLSSTNCVASSVDLWFGASETFGQHVTCLMEHVFVAKFCLTPTQVAALYAAGSAGTGLSSGGGSRGSGTRGGIRDLRKIR